MNTKVCYKYSQNNREFQKEALAFQDTYSKKYLLPPHCTWIKPPVTEEFEVAVFIGDSWAIEPDYRKHLVEGEYVGGKPYFDPAEYWWAEEKYNKEIGDIPEGMSWEKIDKPQVVLDTIALQNQVTQDRQYLKDTDYIHDVLVEEPDKAEKYAPVIVERMRVRATIDPNEKQIEAYKAEIVKEYGEEALNHLN